MTLDGYHICTIVRYQIYTICRWHLLDIIPVVIKSKAIFDWYFLCILTGLEIENKKSLMNFKILFYFLAYVTVVYVNNTLCYTRNQSRLSTLKKQPRLATMKPREWPVVETTLNLHWLAYRQNGVKHYASSFSKGDILFNQNCCQRAKHLTQFPFNVTKNSPERPDRSRHTDERCYETVLCNYLQYTIYM